MPTYWITLTDNERSTFHVSMLLTHLQAQQSDALVHGAQIVPLSCHTQRGSLDYWLRTQVAQDANHPQASMSVVKQLCATGLFVLDKNMKCPETGKVGMGLKVVPF